jgi:predicted nucleic acid-binding Zn ribbon protein
MRFYEMTQPVKNKFAGSTVANRYVRRTSTPLPADAESMQFLRKHVKKEQDPGSNTTYLVLKQYDNDWYRRTFRKDTASIVDFASFYKAKIEPYFTILNTDRL